MRANGTSELPARAGRTAARRRGRLLVLTLGPSLAAAGLVAVAAPQALALRTIQCTGSGSGVFTCTYGGTPAEIAEVGVFTVPAGASSLSVSLRGGEGGDGGSDEGKSGGQGGAGGAATATLTIGSGQLQPGQRLWVLLGAGGGDVQECEAELEERRGGVSGGYGGESPYLAGGTGGADTEGVCSGGGGGGGSFLMRANQLPNEFAPLLAAGGGGGGGGADVSGDVYVDGYSGGKGGPGAQPGDGVDGTGGDVGGGNQGVGAAGSTGAGGGGGGWVGGGGGQAPGAGGAGGCGVPETSGNVDDCTPVEDLAATGAPSKPFRAASTDGLFTVQYVLGAPTGPDQPGGDTGPGDSKPNGGSHPSSNDPNPNTNPSDPKPLEGMPPNTDTALCKPEKKICTVSVSGTDSSFRIDAEDGKQTAVLFAGMNGNWRPASLEASGKPNCPDYTERNSDWVQFGFFRPARGKTWHKTGYMTQRQKMTKAKASALAQKLQVCFAAPYTFPTRPGYRLGTQGPDRVGVLAECGKVPARNGRPAPCLAAREILKVKGGWIVRLTFRVPANGKDPKALG